MVVGQYLSNMEQHVSNFLRHTEKILQLLLAYLQKQIPSRSGFECGFVSGVLFALQTDNYRQQTIHQHWLKDSMTLVLASPSNCKVTSNQPLVVVDFEDSSSEMKQEERLIRLKDDRFGNKLVVYSLVESGFKYSPSSTDLRSSADSPPSIAEFVMDKLADAFHHSSRFYLHQISKFLREELEFLFQTDSGSIGDDATQYLTNYMIGSLNAENFHEIKVDVMKPMNDETTTVFLFKDFIFRNSLCINIISKGTGNTEMSQQPAYQGKNLPLQDKLVPGELYVFNIHQTDPHLSEHFATSSRPSSFHYLPKNIVQLQKNVEGLLDHDFVSKTIIEKLDLVKEIRNALRDRELIPMLQKIRIVLQPFTETVLQGTNLFAMFSGLLRYKRKTTTHFPGHSKTQFHLEMVEYDSKTTPLTIQIEQGSPDFNNRQIPQSITTDSSRKLSLFFEPDTTTEQLVFISKYFAEFDYFGPETPPPAVVSAVCI